MLTLTFPASWSAWELESCSGFDFVTLVSKIAEKVFDGRWACSSRFFLTKVDKLLRQSFAEFVWNYMKRGNYISGSFPTDLLFAEICDNRNMKWGFSMRNLWEIFQNIKLWNMI